MNEIRTYSELLKLSTYEERFNYLNLHGSVGRETFGFDRYFNQRFYQSSEWRNLRNKIIARDKGCDMALCGYEIFGKIVIHHMNPIKIEDFVDDSDYILNPDFLVCVSYDTHNAIHYGNSNFLKEKIAVERKPGDTTLWKR